MKECDEFQGIGKRTPYQAPDGFFESISEKTLQSAKLREQNHRRNLTLWRTIAVAASLAAVVSIGYYLSETETSIERKTDVIAMDKQADVQKRIEQQTIEQQPDIQQPIAQQTTVQQTKEPQSVAQQPEIEKQSSLVINQKAVIAIENEKEKIVAGETDSEVLKDVLADLSDEELLELDAMYKTDPMISESGQ